MVVLDNISLQKVMSLMTNRLMQTYCVSLPTSLNFFFVRGGEITCRLILLKTSPTQC